MIGLIAHLKQCQRRIYTLLSIASYILTSDKLKCNMWNTITTTMQYWEQREAGVQISDFLIHIWKLNVSLSSFDKCLIDKLKQSMIFQVSGGVHKILSLCPPVQGVPTAPTAPTAPTVEIYQWLSESWSAPVRVSTSDSEWWYRDQVSVQSTLPTHIVDTLLLTLPTLFCTQNLWKQIFVNFWLTQQWWQQRYCHRSDRHFKGTTKGLELNNKKFLP